MIARLVLRLFERTSPGWTRTQRILHWLVVILCLSQIPTSQAIVRTHIAHAAGTPQDAADLLLHQVHIVVGISIAFLAALRVILRLVHGAPPLPETMGRALRFASHATHIALYLLLGLSPVAGFLASYVDFAFAPVHVALNWTILAIALVHVAAALWHRFVLGDSVLTRMIRG